MIRVRLTEAQISALQCSRASEDLDFLDLVWCGRYLEVNDNATHLAGLVTELANSEDAFAEHSDDAVAKRQARGACRALTNLAAKLWRLDQESQS